MTGNAAVVQGGLRPVIDEDTWSAEGRLTLRGSYPAPEDGRYEAVLRRRGSTDRHVVAMARDGERFSISIDVARMPSFGRLLPLRDGRWDIFVRRAGARRRRTRQPGLRPRQAGGRDRRQGQHPAEGLPVHDGRL